MFDGDWRAGWIGRVLRVHSPAAHAWGKCWCGADGRLACARYLADIVEVFADIAERAASPHE